MRKCIWICLLLFPYMDFAQQSGMLVIDSIPEKGVLLTGHWKYQSGDQAEWAAVGFDDASWPSIQPEENIFSLTQLHTDSLIWLRLKFSVNQAADHQLALAIEQSGASQVFLNGRKISDYGVISHIPKEVQAYNPLSMPLLFFPDTGAVQVLAIRYAFQPGINYRPMFNFTYPLFKAIVLKTASAPEVYRTTHAIGESAFNIGVSLMLFVVHFLFYLNYPAIKSNLYLSIWALLGLIGGFYFIFQAGITNVQERNFNAVIITILLDISNVFLVYSIYSLLTLKTKKIFWLFIVFTVFDLINSSYGGVAFRDQLSFVYVLFFSAMVIIVSWKAYRQKVNGSFILVIGTVLFISFWTIFIVSLQFPTAKTLQTIFINLANITFPITISAVLGFNFKFINRSLAQKLADVERLSVEKQQILSSQNDILEKQVGERTIALQQSLDHLTTTQEQLIQAEKMASLGELTAGIAHEIQNPLNFVNNFSEVNRELIVEMKAEIDKGNFEEVKAIAADIEGNEEKIGHHGKRADSIVKGMLQHSRPYGHEKEPININTLTEEYLRLAFHGLKAKEKAFNVTMHTDFDPHAVMVPIIPQDIGRVLLNLFNNAFYAAVEKSKSLPPDFEPAVWVKTRQTVKFIEIQVKDNGGGIPGEIKDKIFQPFFTTKPTGQGTGLGLSLSYDIITKGHQGKLTVVSVEGEGATFTIQLPV